MNSREKLILLRNCLMFQRYREKAPSERQAERTNITKLSCQLNPPTQVQFVAATNDAQLNKTPQLISTNYASHRRLVKQEIYPHPFTEFWHASPWQCTVASRVFLWLSVQAREGKLFRMRWQYDLFSGQSLSLLTDRMTERLNQNIGKFN
jgi:hypothetical protein